MTEHSENCPVSLSDDSAHLSALNPWVARFADTFWRSAPEVAVTASFRQQAHALLFARLLNVAKPSLDELLHERMRARNPLLTFDLKLATSRERCAAATALADELAASDCAALFELAPYLRTLLERELGRFSIALGEVLERIARDRDEIAASLLSGRDFGSLTGISADQADLHFHGRTTLALFAEGGGFFYKPHDCRADVFYHDFAERWMDPLIAAPRCLAKDGYGYCERIEHTPVTTESEVERYCFNLGALAAAAHALCSSDLHSENVIAHGTVPAVVDVETMLTPVVAALDGPEEDAAAFDFDVACSIMPSGLLPSGFPGQQLSPFFDTGRACLPLLDGVRHTAVGHERAVLEGFEHAYRRLLAHRDEIAASLDALADVPMRRLLRNTDFYALLLGELAAPRNLRSKETQRAVVARIRNVTGEKARRVEEVVAWEERCLLEGDVPYFSALGDGLDLLGYGNVVFADGFRSSGIACARERLARMGEEDLRFERDILAQALESAVVDAPKEGRERAAAANEAANRRWERTSRGSGANASQAWGEAPEADGAGLPPARPLTPGEALAEADVLFAGLRDRALTGPSGASLWLMLDSERGCLRVPSGALSDGIGGLAIFFAAMAAAHGADGLGGQACELARRCFDRSAKEVETLERGAAKAAALSCGRADGFAGMLQAFVLCGRLLADSAYAELAQQTLALIPREAIELGGLDQYAGVAGLLDVVCSHDELATTPRGRDVAQWCAMRLLRAQELRCEDGLALWDTLGVGRAISGWGHGMAGIAVALLRAHRLLGDCACESAAHDALAFELGAYREDLGSWPDFRENPLGERAMHGVCSGAPSVGLALLSCRELGIESPEVDRGIRRAIEACRRAPILGRDHLCCGNAAPVEFLLSAAQCQGNPELERDARLLLGIVVERKRALGDFRYLPSQYRNFFEPSLFYGAAGIGYELLRAADPMRVPSLFQ